MQKYGDCPQILKEFLIYHENIKGQSQLTIQEYYLDLRMFLRFMKLMRRDMPMSTPLEEIPIKDIDLNFIREIETSDIFDFLSYLANDRISNENCSYEDPGIGSAARARKLSSIKSFFKYLKKEETNRHNFRTYTELHQSVFEYIEGFYNTRRPHGSLGYLTPNEMENLYWNQP